MSAPVIIYDTSLNKVAYLPKAFDVAYHLRANEVGRAWFSVPVDDPHLSEIQELRYAEIFNGDTRVELFRILTSWKDGDGNQRFECEHVLGTLMDDEFDDIFYAGAVAGTEDAIDDILDEQGTGRWTQGTCAFSEDYIYEWNRGDSLLKGLLDIPKRFQSGYFWTYDTESYPWTINLIEPPTTVTAYVDYGRNMKSISRKKDLSGLVTKLYPHGANAGTDQIGISTEEPSGHDYITNNTGTYGTIVHHWTDQRYTTEAELYAAAVDHLATISEPAYTYKIDQADLFRLTGESIDSYSIGALVQVDNPEISITTDVRVMEIKKSDITGKPGDISLTFANKGEEFDLSQKLSVNDLSAMNPTDMPGGIPGQMPAAPDGAGLYVSTDYMGYHNGTNWTTYMDITGKLWADYGGYYIHFDPAATPPLTIKADGTWEGDVSITQLTAGDLTVGMNVDTGGSLKSSNFVTGTSGWQIEADGTAEFQNATIRGSITITGGSGIGSLTDAGDLAVLDSVGASNCDTTIISGGKIITGLLTADNIQTGTLAVTYTAAKCTDANADQTSTHTSADTSKVNNLASTTLIVGGKIGTNLIVTNSITANSVRTNEIYIDGDLQFKPGSTWNSIVGIETLANSDSGADTESYITLTDDKLFISSGTALGNEISIWSRDDIVIASDAGTIAISCGENITISADDDIIMSGLPASDPSVDGALYVSSGFVRISSG